MAEIQVSSWSDFLLAVQESGADVVLPENAVWNMNEISPEGVSSLPEIRCSNIYGNGTEIRGLRTDSNFYSNSHVLEKVANLHFIDFILEGQSLFSTSNNTRDGYIAFSGCKFSGLCGTQTQGILMPGRGTYGDDYGTIGAERCSFVVDAQVPGWFYTARYLEYSRVHCAVPNGYMLGIARWSYLRMDQPTTESIPMTIRASVLDGQMQNAVTPPTVDTQFISIFNKDGAPQIEDTAYLKGVTTAQLRDPQYLASIGFPIGYDPPEQ